MKHFLLKVLPKTLLRLSIVIVANGCISCMTNDIPKASSKKQPRFIQAQKPGKIYPSAMKKKGPTRIVISLSKQRVYVYKNGQLAVDTPTSTGKRKGMTPKGHFKITQKDKDHRSNIYGNFVDSEGRIIVAGVSRRIDSAPSGTHFRGAPMDHFLRITDRGVGMHAGYLPGYPASHGCVRLPADMAAAIYEIVPLNTPVIIEG